MGWFHVLFVVLLAMAVSFYSSNPYSSHRVILVDHIADEYDYIVVGGGSAGSVVTARLAEEENMNVLLLEAGGFYDESQLFHIPLYYYMSMHTDYDWEYYTEPQEHSQLGMNDRRSYWPRGRVLGGSSITNGIQYTRGSPFEYDQWAKNGCDGWSYEDVLPYFLKSEDIQIPELKSSEYHNSGGPLGVSRGKVTPLTDIYLQAGKEMGYDVTDYNGVDQQGFSEAQFTARKGVRQSTGLAFLGRNKKNRNLDIAIKSFVTKIEIHNKRAVGVYFIRNGRKQHVKARKEVIVSGGAINSAQLLMLSGIGPKKHLSEIGIPVVQDLPVGQNLQDHQCAILHHKIKKSYGITADRAESLWTDIQYKLFGTGVRSISGIDGSAFLHINSSDKGKARPDIQFIIFSLPFSANIFNYKYDFAKEFLVDSANVHGFTNCLSVTHPLSKGSLLLRSSDPFDYPILDPKYLTEKEDMEKYIAGIRLWEKFLETDAIKDLGANIDQMKMSFCSEHAFRSDAYWECFTRHTAITIYHHSGTCRMGPESDPTAVVDTKLRVRGVSGLRVVDASIFPNVTSGNTNAPVIMVAEKAADMILGKNTVTRFQKNK